MSAEIHAKILEFLKAQFGLKNSQTCVRLELLFAPGTGFKEESLRSWMRESEPEIFETPLLVEQLTTQIIELAEAEADAKAPGKYRFVVRTFQHLNGRAQTAFQLSPSFSDGDETALVVGNKQDVIAGHAGQLMRINAQMFDGVLRLARDTNARLSDENAELRAENLTLRREIEDARSTKQEREFKIAMEMESRQFKAAGMKQLSQFVAIAMAKITGAGATPDAQAPLVMMLAKFGESVKPEQLQALMQVFDQTQMALFFEIMQTVQQAVEAKQNSTIPPSPSPSNGANGAPRA